MQMIEAHVDRFKGPAAHSDALYSHMGEGRWECSQAAAQQACSQSTCVAWTVSCCSSLKQSSCSTEQLLPVGRCHAAG